MEASEWERRDARTPFEGSTSSPHRARWSVDQRYRDDRVVLRLDRGLQVDGGPEWRWKAMLTAAEARRVAEALLRAADAIESGLPPHDDDDTS